MFWNKALIVFDHIATLFNDLHDAGIGRGPANAQLFHLFNQAGICIARRRLGEMLIRLHLIYLQGLPLGQGWQQTFTILAVFLRIIKAFTVNFQKSRKDNNRPGCPHGNLVSLSRDISPCLVQLGICHLAGKGALPD